MYTHINALGDRLRKGLQEIVGRRGAAAQVTGTGSLACLFFTDKAVVDYETAKTSDTGRFGDYFRHMLSHGFYFAPSQFEAIFLSNAHTDADIDRVLETADAFFAK